MAMCTHAYIQANSNMHTQRACTLGQQRALTKHLKLNGNTDVRRGHPLQPFAHSQTCFIATNV
eukprot:1159412-Pelagomonas_calceolata.AAC.10